MATSTSVHVRSDAAWSRRSWRGLSIRLCVALAFADASIVVLALPQIVGQLHTTISHVTWVIMAYNLALIVGVFAYLLGSRRFAPRYALFAGLALFGLASLGCAAAQHLAVLVAFRCVQGLGGALVVCASLPLLARAHTEKSATASWAAAAAIGAAVGPAAGGILTEVFDWRSIFYAQAPAALIAGVAVLSATSQTGHVEERDGTRPWPDLAPAVANVALLLLSAALIGALFISVLLLINVWQLAPIGAAAVVSALPVTTAVVERAARGRQRLAVAVMGAVLLAVGLVAMAQPSHRQIAWLVLALTLAGAGLGLSFTALTDAALKGRGTAVARAARTVAARDAGLVVGLLVLTPVFVHDLDKAPGAAIPKVAAAIIQAPLSPPLKDDVTRSLLVAYHQASQAEMPDVDGAFAAVRRRNRPTRQEGAALGRVQRAVHDAAERAATHSFRHSLLYAALFAIAVVPILLIGRALRGPRDPTAAETTERSAAAGRGA